MSAFSQAAKMTLIHEQLNTHVAACVYKAFPPAQARRILNKLEFYYTPKHGSWLNMPQIELSVLAMPLSPCRICDKETLKQEVAACVRVTNRAATTVDWQFTTADARIKLKKLYPVI